MNIYTIKNVTKTYGEGNAQVTALKNVTIGIPEGEFVVILGASGSGKSTFLNIIGCMDRPTSGKVLCEDQEITQYSKKDMTKFRCDKIGFVFQSYNLLPDLTAIENVEFSTELAGLPKSSAKTALELVGLKERLNHFPAQLSGGEQQRVSIARSIAKHPSVLLCDEPTGALDFQTGIMVLDVIKTIQREQKTSVVLITHNKEIAKIADRIIELRSGEIIRETINDNPIAVSEVEW